MLATYTVNVDYDASTFSDQDSIVTLREAIFEAQSNPNADTIDFAPGLSGATITLGKDANGNPIATGELQITESVTIDGTIDGAGPSEVSLGITVDASGNDPTPNSTPLDGNLSDDGDGSSVFTISPAAANTHITLVGLTITGGDQGFPLGGGVHYESFGFNGSLTIRNCKVVENFTAGEGAGVFASGPTPPTNSNLHGLDLRIVESTISGNALARSGPQTGFGGGGL